VVLFVLKKIQGGFESASATNPTCSKPAAPKVATNSRARPGPYAAFVVARAPLTVRRPPPTATVPPAPQAAPVQDAGKPVPPNSSLTVGARITSPFAIEETAVFVSGVPLPKSAAVVSVALDEAASVVNVHVTSDPSGFPLASVTVPETVA
jgi:hypothetical protein